MNKSGIGRIRSQTTQDAKRPMLKRPTQLKKPAVMSPATKRYDEESKITTPASLIKPLPKKKLRRPETTKVS